METLILKRGPSKADGTPGELFRNGAHLCYTMELPWKDNRNEVSCIPVGVYPVVRHRWNTPEHSKSGWKLEGVPNRSGVLIHRGNTIRDILGCILVGNRRGTLKGLPAVLDSGATMNILRATLPDEFILEITA
jgi:hypothetical protein